MKRLGLAIVAVALVGHTAFAFRVRKKDVCGLDGVSLPRNGAIGVPTNARVWRLYRDTPPSGGALPALEPYTAVDLPWYHVSFTTGAGPDHEPPAPPRIGVVSFAVTNGPPKGLMDVATLQLSAAFSADTALLRVRLFDGGREITYYMPADGWPIDEPGFQLHAGIVHGELTAIDLAGNESPPAPFEAEATYVPGFSSSCARSEIDYNHVGSAHDDRGPGIAVYGPLGLELVVVVGLVIAASRRSRKRASAAIEPLSLAAAEQLARRMRMLGALGALGLVAAVAVVAPLGPALADAIALLSPLLLWALWTTLAWWSAATRLLRVTARDGAVTVVRHDLVVVVAAPDGRSSLTCPRRLIVHAQQHSLPKATTL